ncbi:MarR family winged helix-turn-helix transcriptional regulator [Rosettibacter firmus]|uniref:MarR family winged helix-turn-helix transcriptional regulator n=1 Tax=Rosettibacter firmus TaxID=3111522 RepID=UPI00336C2334
MKKRYGKKIDLALNTWIKLARAYASFNRKIAENIRTYGLTQPQFAVIEVLGHLGPLKVGEICKKMLVTGGNMTLVLDNVEKMGLIERVHSKEDRRAIIVQLTKEGKELFDKVFYSHAEYITQLMSVLTQEEQKIMGSLLKKLGLTISQNHT